MSNKAFGGNFAPASKTLPKQTRLSPGKMFAMASQHLRPNPRGPGRISGNVRIQGEPTGSMIVKLFETNSMTLIMETQTTPDGNYQFDGLEMNYLYDVIAYDPLGEWEKRVSSRRVPINIE